MWVTVEEAEHFALYTLLSLSDLSFLPLDDVFEEYLVK